MKQYEDLLLEMRRNDNANEKAGDDPFERRKNVSTMNMGRFKINKIILKHESSIRDRTEFERNEEVYEENYIERTKKAIFNKFK